MSSSSTPKVRVVTPGMRRWLRLDALLVFVTGVQCFVLAEYTALFFAWTIQPPLTAAFLGAAYWAALPLVWLSARAGAWARARVAVYGVLVFTTVTTVATLLHLDRFHLGAGQPPLALLAGWAWMIVYLAVPPSLLFLLLRQRRVPGGDPARVAPLPTWARAVLVAQAVVMLPLGVWMFAAPGASGWWPWALTPLTSRAVGAWLLGIGLTTAHAAWEGDWARLRPAMASYALLGALQLVNVARFAGTVEWNEPGAPLYVLFLVSVLGMGLYGWRAATRAEGRQVFAEMGQRA